MFRPISAGMLCLLAGSAHAQSAPITGATCVSTGTVEVNATIVITGGVFDGGCRTYTPGPGMDANSHSETIAAKSVLFHVQNGAQLRKVIVDRGRGTGRAIEISNGATLENVRIVTAAADTYIRIRTTGLVNISGVTSLGKPSLDRHLVGSGIQLMVKLSNCIFTDGPRVFRQSGGTTYPTTVSFDRCDFSNITDAIARTDAPLSTAAIANSRLHAVKLVCRGYAPGKCVETGNVTY